MQRHRGREDLGPFKEKNKCHKQLQKEGANDSQGRMSERLLGHLLVLKEWRSILYLFIHAI